MALLSYPIFLKNGESFDLRTLYTQSVFEFATDSEHPTWLTIENDYELTVDSDAVSETTPVFVELDNSAELYAVVNPATAPSLRVDIDALNMLTDSSYDLFLIVQNADSIAFETGQTQPTGSSISDGVFTIGTANGTAYFTATNDDGDTDFAIQINTVQRQRNLDEFSDTKRIRVEIAGIDVSEDFLDISELSETLDAITLTDFTVDDATLALSSDNTNGYRYNDGVANNFWQTNSLNAGGYQESINIFDEYLVSGVWVSHVVFSGVILRATENFEQTQVSLICVDVSSRLRNRIVADFGTTEKWGVLTTGADSDAYETSYAPEETLLPIQPDTGQAWTDTTPITLQRSAIPSEGPRLINTGQLSASSLNTRNAFADDPLLNFKTLPRSARLQLLANHLAITEDAVYQVNLDVDTIELTSPYILNLGNTAFDIENTRITRTPVDWVHDPTHDRILTLLSHPDTRFSDLLIEHTLESNSRKVLREFDSDIRVHRICRLDATTYYLLTTSYSDSDNESIYEYETDTDTLTERVDPSNSYPPVLGDFKCVGTNLYYEYFVVGSGDYGVAQLANDGTTSEMIQADDRTQLGVFDVTDTQEIYFLTVGGASSSNVSLASYTGGSAGGVTRTLTVTNGNELSNVRFRFRVRLVGNENDPITLSIFINGSNTPTVTVSGQEGQQINGNITGFTTITSVGFQYTGIPSGIASFGLSATINPINNLKIQRRQTDGTIQELSDDVIEGDTTEASTFGDGEYDVLYHDDSLYVIYKSRPVDTSNQNSLNFVRFDVSGSTIPLPGDVIIDANTNTVNEPLHLFIHDDQVHFMRNTTLGDVNRIETDGSFTPLGNVWYDDSTALNQSVLRPLSVGEDIHFTMAFGDLSEDILTDNSDLSSPDNFLHLLRTTQLQYVITNTEFSESPYDALAELARLVNATLSFEQNIVHIRDRNAIKAETDGNTGV